VNPITNEQETAVPQISFSWELYYVFIIQFDRLVYFKLLYQHKYELKCIKFRHKDLVEMHFDDIAALQFLNYSDKLYVLKHTRLTTHLNDKMRKIIPHCRNN